MALDGYTLSFLTQETHDLLTQSRVDKIYQPDHFSLVFHLRKEGKNHRLLLSSHPQTGRFCITSEKPENPEKPPLFCMVLRKYLEGSRLTAIRQIGLERIVHFIFDTTNELGDPVQKIIIGEFMGKHSNLILIDEPSGTIHDAIQRFPLSENAYREIIPGKNYFEPPAQNKYLLDQLTSETLQQLFITNHLDKSTEKAVLSVVSGAGPATAKEICLRSDLDPSARCEELGIIDYQRLGETIKDLEQFRFADNKTYFLVKDALRYLDFTPFQYLLYESFEQIPYTSINQLIEDFIGGRDRINKVKQRKDHLLKMIEKETIRLEKRFDLNQHKIKDSQDAETYRIYGDLITANLYQLSQGKKADVINFYSEEQEILSIPMDEQLTPNQNAQRYYKKYNKSKAGAANALKQMEIIRQELYYLDSIRASIENTDTFKDLEEIKSEMTEAGYLKKEESSKKKKAEKISSPTLIHFEGYDIYLGNNNKQNDYLTMKFASSSDVWFHVKDIPGSHVLVRNPGRTALPDRVIQKAAEIAARHSKAKNASVVAVDYTLKKHVKKPKGSKPGFVLYDNASTISVKIN